VILPAKPPGSRVFPEVFSARALMLAELPPVRWIVPGILPEGATLLAGAPKMGKSWLALGVAIAVASGGVALGTRPVEGGEVLFLALEDNTRRLQKRTRKVLDGGEVPGRLHMATEWPTVDAGGAERLSDWLSVHPGARLVVVDVLKRVRPDVSARKSTYDADYEAAQALKDVADEHAVAVLVLHHTRKQAAEDPLDEVSGSRGLSGAADGIMVLKRDRGRADAYLHVTGRDIEEEAELALTWDANLGSWALAGAAEEYRLSKERLELVAALKGADELMSPKDLSEALDKNVGAVKMMLGEMVKAGQVSNPSRGKYGLPRETPDFTDNAYFQGPGGVESKEDQQSQEGSGRGNCLPLSADLGAGESATIEELRLRRNGAGEASYEDERRVRELVQRGFSEHSARIEVLAKDHPLGCECEACL
jgi:hypothetical protein